MELWAGNRVRFAKSGEYLHEWDPKRYPAVGTTGVVYAIYERDVAVKWQDGSTSGDDLWLVPFGHLEYYNEPDIGEYDATALNDFFAEFRRGKE